MNILGIDINSFRTIRQHHVLLPSVYQMKYGKPVIVGRLVRSFLGENPQTVADSPQPLCRSGWENSSPTTHRGAVWKDGAEIHWGWSLTSALILIIQWRRQRHLTSSTTHDIVSREFNSWKSFDLMLESNLQPLTPSAGCLTARPPELTVMVRSIRRSILYTPTEGPCFSGAWMTPIRWRPPPNCQSSTRMLDVYSKYNNLTLFIILLLHCLLSYRHSLLLVHARTHAHARTHIERTPFKMRLYVLLLFISSSSSILIINSINCGCSKTFSLDFNNETNILTQ